MIPSKNSRQLVALALCALFTAGHAAVKSDPKSMPVAAEPPAAVASGVQANYGVKLGAFFKDEHKKAARAAFAQRYSKGKDCPTGMERGSKGCAPPVQGRYWAVGQRLQPAATTNPVPDPVKAKLPPAPSGYEYLLAGEDILLVSKGLHLVVDMIEDVTG
ncbi:MAG: hypothetical protein JWQ07_3813 [Ramlibacter sp.]|nr:hypothetical protein [Ramlibacter sp.]